MCEVRRRVGQLSYEFYVGHISLPSRRGGSTNSLADNRRVSLRRKYAKTEPIRDIDHQIRASSNDVTTVRRSRKDSSLQETSTPCPPGHPPFSHENHEPIDLAFAVLRPILRDPSRDENTGRAVADRANKVLTWYLPPQAELYSYGHQSSRQILRD